MGCCSAGRTCSTVVVQMMDYPTQHAVLHSRQKQGFPTRLDEDAMREAKLKTGVHCRGCQEQLHTPPYDNPPPACPSPCSSHSKQAQKENSQCTQTCAWLGSYQPFSHKPKQQTDQCLGHTALSQASQFCYSGSGRSGKQLCCFCELQWLWRRRKFPPAQHGSPVPAEPGARASLFPGSGASTRLFLSFTLPMRRKLAFLEAESWNGNKT